MSRSNRFLNKMLNIFKHFFKYKVANSGIMLFFILTLMGIVIKDSLTINNFFFRLIPVTLFLFTIFPIIDLYYKLIAKRENVDLSIYPSTKDDEGILKQELEFLESLRNNRGHLRVMSEQGKFSKVFGFVLLILSSVAMAICLGFSKFSYLVNWLAIFTFALGLIQMVDEGANNEIDSKINEVKSNLNDIKEDKLEKKMDKLLSLIEKLQR